MSVQINRTGYLVNHNSPTDERRTYACADDNSVDALVRRLTGRNLNSFARTGNIYLIPGMQVAFGLHIYTTVQSD